MLVSALTNKMVELTLNGVNFNLAPQGQQTNKRKEKTSENLKLFMSFYPIPQQLFFYLSFFLLLRFPHLSTSCLRPYLERATASHRCGVCNRAVEGACWCLW